MNTLYENATPEELLEVDNVCIICREEMTTGAKKLPCGHIFHTSCLRSWFQRQQTCPTCRMDILRQTPASTQAAAAAAANQRQEQQTNQQQNTAPPANTQPQNNIQNGNPPNVVPPAPFPQFPFMPFPVQQPTTNAPKESEGATAAGANTTPNAFPFGPFGPSPLLMPPPPLDYGSLTMAELERLEGTERANVEARIGTLRNVHILLDAASLQLSQYYSVVNNMAARSPTPPTRDESKNDEIKKEETEDSSLNEEESELKDQAQSLDVGATALVDPEDASELRRRRLQKFENP